MINFASLNHRQRAILRAVAGGRAEITSSCEPDLYVDGLPCCDQETPRDLVRSGFLHAACRGRPGQRISAALTDRGTAVLAGEKRFGEER